MVTSSPFWCMGETLFTKSVCTQSIQHRHFWQSKSFTYLTHFTSRYFENLSFDTYQLIVSWFECFSDSRLLRSYLQIFAFIHKYQKEANFDINQIRTFFPQYKPILLYLEQSWQTTIHHLFTGSDDVKILTNHSTDALCEPNEFNTTHRMLTAIQQIHQIERLLYKPKYQILLTVDTRANLVFSRTFQFCQHIKWHKTIQSIARIVVFGSVFCVGFWFMQQRSANAMMHEPCIVVSMSSSDLPTLGSIGTYTELQCAQRYAKNAISQSYQRSHNLSIKSWQVIEIPKTATPVILLDPPRHQYLDQNRSKYVRNKTVFADQYLHKLIEEGYIDANGVWTTQGLKILEQYDLSCDNRLLMSAVANRPNQP